MLFADVHRVAIGPAAIDLPVPGTVQPAALALAALAAVLLFGLKLGLARVLAVCAAGGLVLSLLPI